MIKDRYELGLIGLEEIDGAGAKKIIESLHTIAPDLARYLVEYAFCDIYTRDIVDIKSKKIAVIAALLGKGNVTPQLKAQIHAAFKNGVSLTEIKETIIQMVSYLGFPVAVNGMILLKEILHERANAGLPLNDDDNTVQDSVSNRFEKGLEQLGLLDSMQYDKLKENFEEISPDLTQFVVELGYGDIFSRKGLDIKLRQIATISALTAMGTAAPQLKFHINAAVNIGVTEREIAEILLLLTIYLGFPVVINAMNILKEISKERYSE